MDDLNDDCEPRIVRRSGGWFVTGVEWSGPWRNMKAAELARDGEYALAHAENRADANWRGGAHSGVGRF